MDKVSQAKEIIKEALSNTNSPIIYWSGGKDSTVMLHMVREFVPDIEVVYLFGKNMLYKNLYTFNLASVLGLKVHTYPPTDINYIQKDDYFEIVHFYYIDGKDWHMLYNGCRKYKQGEDYACAVKDFINIPTIDKFNHNWDCIFHGQKETESVHVIDKYTIPEPIVKYGYGVMAMPLYNWVDDDIWDYIHANDIPYQKDRYLDKKDLLNNDVLPTCFECIDYRNEGKYVVCPQIRELIKFQGKSEKEHKDYMNLVSKKMAYISEV